MRRASPSSSSNSRAVLVGYLRSGCRQCARRPRAAVAFPAVDGQPDRAQQRVGQLERIAPGDVEAVEQPTPDEVEIVGHRRADIAAERAQLGERLAGVAVGIEERASTRVVRDRGDEAFELAGRARRHRRRAAHHRERVGRRDVGPGSEVREQVTDRHHRRPRETHVLEDHLRVVLATAGQVRDQTVVGEGVGVDRLQLAMDPDRGRLERLVPLAQLLAPDLALPHLLGAREALRDLVLGCRVHRVVREAVDVLRSPTTRGASRSTP